jgi:hypothetical protein
MDKVYADEDFDPAASAAAGRADAQEYALRYGVAAAQAHAETLRGQAENTRYADAFMDEVKFYMRTATDRTWADDPAHWGGPTTE